MDKRKNGQQADWITSDKDNMNNTPNRLQINRLDQTEQVEWTIGRKAK